MMITRTVYDSYNFLCDSVPFSFGLVAIHPNIFSAFFFFIGVHLSVPHKAILMSTHNIGFYEEISKIISYQFIIKYHQTCTLSVLLHVLIGGKEDRSASLLVNCLQKLCL